MDDIYEFKFLNGMVQQAQLHLHIIAPNLLISCKIVFSWTKYQHLITKLQFGYLINDERTSNTQSYLQ